MQASDFKHFRDIFIGDLDHLGFQRFLPHAALQPWVQCYWIMHAQLPSTGFTETVYPDGGTSINFYFNTEQEPQLIFSATQVTRSLHLGGPQNCLGIRFRPGGVYHLLRLAMPDWIGGEYSAADVGPHPVCELQKRLGDLVTMQQRIDLVEQWLLQRVAQLSVQPGLLQHLLPQLIQHQSSIEALCDWAAMSRRNLERKFYLEAGLTPSQIKQFNRVKLARKLISGQPSLPLVDVAQQAGFYDQAHFNRQFQRLTGMTPGQYRRKKMSQKYNPS